MKANRELRPKFQLGQVVATPGALEAFDAQFLGECLTRHASGDWGEVCEEDATLNNESLTNGTRVLSCYSLAGKKLWLITEAEPRQVTTFLLPEEY